MRGRIWLVCLSLSLIVLPAIAQQNTPPQASIEGRTFSTDSQPLRKTTLTLHAYGGRGTAGLRLHKALRKPGDRSRCEGR